MWMAYSGTSESKTHDLVIILDKSAVNGGVDSVFERLYIVC